MKSYKLLMFEDDKNNIENKYLKKSHSYYVIQFNK
jgi:hypothetical protein